MAAKGNAKRYIEIAVYHVEALLTGCKFRSIADISPSKVTSWLKEQRDKNGMHIWELEIWLRG